MGYLGAGITEEVIQPLNTGGRIIVSNDTEITKKNTANIIEVNFANAAASGKSSITIKLPRSTAYLRFNTLTFVLVGNTKYNVVPVKLIIQCDDNDVIYKSTNETSLKSITIDSTFSDQKLSLTHDQSGKWRSIFLTDSSSTGFGSSSILVPLGSDLLEYFKKAPSGFYRLVGTDGALTGYINTLGLPYNNKWYDITVSSHEIDNYKAFSIIGSDGSLLTASMNKGNYTGIMGSSVPIGMPIPYPGSTPPDGYLLMNGSSFDTTNFKQLAKLYPTGILPDMRGEFIRGWDGGRNVDSGRSLLSNQSDELKSHYHPITANSPGSSDDGWYLGIIAKTTYLQGRGVDAGVNGGTLIATPTVHTKGYVGYSGGSETRPRNISFNYIVRAA